MIPPWAIIRGAAKLALWAFAALIAFVALWFAGNRWLDESPDPHRHAFLVSAADQLPDSSNIAVGILGLTAPANQDFVQYGAKVKSLYKANAPWADLQRMLDGPNTLKTSAELQPINCWLDPDGPPMKGCPSFEQAPAFLAEHRELLERFKQLRQMKAYSSVGIGSNRAYLFATKLAVIEIQIDLRNGHVALAYRKWRDEVSFVRNTLRGPDTWVGKAVGLVAIGLSLPVLDSILLADPNLARQHASELKTLLKPEGMTGFNPEGIVRTEYLFLRAALESEPQQVGDWPVDRLHWLAYHLCQKERIYNRYYRFAREYAAVLGLPWPEYVKNVPHLRQTFDDPSNWEVAIDPFGTLFIADYVRSQLKARELVRQMHYIDGRLMLSTALVQIVAGNISDSAIPHFLESAAGEIFDPFTGKPIRWNPKERALYFPDPEYPCAMYALARVPPPAGLNAPAPRVGDRIC